LQAAFLIYGMNHIQISIEAKEEQQEILISELAEFDAIGFEQTTSHLLSYFEEENFRSYEITKLLKDYVFHFTTLPKQNWNAVWESNFEPVVVDDFCAIRAEFHKPIQNVQHEIIITPKMSFGTGHHATTYMMIQQMRNISFIDKKVFDFGTGTGILAILATKLGAASVTAIDNDEWSIKNAEENFEKNNVHSICLYQSSTVSEKNFDIILANINRSVLEQYSSTLVNLLSSQGVLLVSGLLKEDEPFIVELFDELTLYNSQQNQNWISLLFTTK
jgi:ribosomal protein L11 methyltransferase